MKILHGSVRTAVRVKVDDANATPENSMGYIPVTDREHVAGHGYYQEHGDATFSIDPDGTLYLYGDPSKPAWLWVGDELNNSVFNTAHDDALARDERIRSDVQEYAVADAAASHEPQPD